uniref:CASC1 C-terminal domain-containing protein n=1 Tax=Musca domestica TaxID=7370 RepID=A0A1I8MVP7_MUSDO
MKAREQKYSNRLNDLRVCLNFIDDALIQVEKLDELQLIADKWHNFLTCNPLPKPYLPPDLRLFFTKLKFFESRNIEANIDWPLAVDERSILAQNIFRKNLTRSYLQNRIKPEFGLQYNRHVNDCLSVIRRIEYFLDNDVEVAKCPLANLEDIKELKIVVQDEILEFFNRYTYRVLCGEEAYMIPVDPITMEYCFSGDNFQMHIWSLKNVPVRISHLDEPRLVANFHQIQLQLHIPSTMLSENLTIRAIRMNFDHLSEKAKSFTQLITVPVDNLNAGIQDLHECLINEWLMQLDLQNRVREDLIQKRLDYEEQLRQYEEEQAKKKGKKAASDEGDGKKSKKTKIVKPTKEPPIIEADVVPDTYADFLEEEQKQYESFINTIYNPETLDLDSDEINLKKFFILGGVYQLYYVSKPNHVDLDFERFNMTWHYNEGKLKIDEDMFIPPTSRFMARRTTRLMSHLSLSRMSRLDKNLNVSKSSTDPECPWFVLTFKLPEYLCHWGEPLACHYEIIEKILEEKEEVVPAPMVSSMKKSKGPRKLPSKVSLTGIQTHPVAESFPLNRSYASEAGNSMLKLRRLGASHRFSQGNFFQSSLSLRISQADIPRRARSSDGTLNVEDFFINCLLNKAQVRHLERHCVPRIISSFKFPKELREEELEAFRKKPKSKGGTLLRKQQEALEESNAKKQAMKTEFSYSVMQNNPERLYPTYPREELVRIVKYLPGDSDEQSHEPKTFLELLRLLNSIKSKYKNRPRLILDVKTIKSKTKWQNKRLKYFFKKYDRPTLQRSISMEKNIGKATKRIAAKHKEENLKSSLASESKRDLRRETSKVQIVEPSPGQEPPDVSVLDISSESQVKVEKFAKKEPKKLRYSHWTTRHILHSEYDQEKQTMTIQTDRLGYIGFAFKRYEHFPFKYWSLEPSQEDPDNEVIFTLETQYVRCVLYCTPNGIRGHVTEPTKKFVRNPKMYLIIEKPMKDYKEFKKIFKENYLNIFAEHDACYYIENGYFSEKHLATEMHSYCCMAIHSTQMKFQFSQWNRLAKRRDIILKFEQYKDLPENMVEVRITPEEAFFVEITELCSDDLDVIKLQYSNTWRNIGTYTDLHHLINSMYPAATDLRCKNPKLISCIRDLLNEIRPLSFS